MHVAWLLVSGDWRARVSSTKRRASPRIDALLVQQYLRNMVYAGLIPPAGFPVVT